MLRVCRCIKALRRVQSLGIWGFRRLGGLLGESGGLSRYHPTFHLLTESP